VAFHSYATNLAPAPNPNDFKILVRDMLTGEIRRVVTSTFDGGFPTGSFGSGVFDPQISSDAGAVLFRSSFTNVVAGDTNGRTDVFLIGNPFK